MAMGEAGMKTVQRGIRRPGRALRRGASAAALLACGLLFAAPALGSSGTFERAWGKDVLVTGGTGFEICAVAASCQAGGTTSALGGELYYPFGVATDASGNVYVADRFNNRIQKFDAAGNFERAWGKDVVVGGSAGFEICTVAASCQAGGSGVMGGEFDGLNAVASDGAGNVYVAEQNNRRVQKFDSSGNFVAAWGKDVLVTGGTGFEVCTVATSCKVGLTGSLGGELAEPRGIAADATGNVYVVDRTDNRVQKFDSSGNFVAAWGKDVLATGGTDFEICLAAANCQAGANSGVLGDEMATPSGVGTDAAGNVYVADSQYQRVQKFDSSGNFLRTWGEDVDTGGGIGPEVCTVASNCQAGVYGGLGGEFKDASGVSVDAAGNSYVADFNNNRIQKFDSSGNFVAAWGKDVLAGGGTGFEVCTAPASCQTGATATTLGGELSGATAVATDAAGGLYVADFYNNRIQKFAPDPPPTSPPASQPALKKKCKKGSKLKKGKCVKKKRKHRK